MALAVTSGIR